MPWRNTPQNFFPRYGAAHSHAQEPTPGSAVEFLGESVRKNRPLVLRSNIAGSWARGGGDLFCMSEGMSGFHFQGGGGEGQ